MLPRELLNELRRCATESGQSIRGWAIAALWRAIALHDARSAEMAPQEVIEEVEEVAAE